MLMSRALLEMARGYPVDMFARMTRHYMSPGTSSEERNRQHQNRWASLVQDPDGSWRLSAYFDHDTGKRVSISLNQMVRNYRNSQRSHEQVSSQQRRADALANLITGEGPHRRPDVTLLMIADYDTVTRELRSLRYDDGLPVSVDQVARLAAGAKILPAIFDADGDPLWLGRAQRDASAGQRIVLAARDGGCVNCGSPVEQGEPHHIRWFSRGGPTDIDNLALLCERCHHLIHDDGWQLHRNTMASTDSGRRHIPGPASTCRLGCGTRSGTPCCEPDGGHARLWSKRPRRPVRTQRVKMSWSSMMPWSSTETTTGAVGAVTP